MSIQSDLIRCRDTIIDLLYFSIDNNCNKKEQINTATQNLYFWKNTICCQDCWLFEKFDNIDWLIFMFFLLRLICYKFLSIFCFLFIDYNIVDLLVLCRKFRKNNYNIKRRKIYQLLIKLSRVFVFSNINIIKNCNKFYNNCFCQTLCLWFWNISIF